MDRRIKPWVNKKIVEYIGEPEPTLVEFICSKVLIGSQPQSIIDDVQMVTGNIVGFVWHVGWRFVWICQVLDEEAEVFVVKMWRLLIYELEAKKLGLMKWSARLGPVQLSPWIVCPNTQFYYMYN